jgi:hypothetical protein
MARVDIGNFMGVINATTQDEDGIRFSGEHMPSGKDVVAKGVTLGQLTSDRGMAETWFETIKGTHEREKEQINHERSTQDTPDLVIRGKDGGPQDGGGGEPPARVYPASIEEELQARQEALRKEYEVLAERYFSLEEELRRVTVALEAITGDA